MGRGRGGTRSLTSPVPAQLRWMKDNVQWSFYYQDGNTMDDPTLKDRAFLRVKVQSTDTTLDGSVFELAIANDSDHVRIGVPLVKGDREIIAGEVMIELDGSLPEDFDFETDARAVTAAEVEGRQ